MKYKMMRKVGALQEGFQQAEPSYNEAMEEQAPFFDDFEAPESEAMPAEVLTQTATPQQLQWAPPPESRSRSLSHHDAEIDPFTGRLMAPTGHPHGSHAGHNVDPDDSSADTWRDSHRAFESARSSLDFPFAYQENLSMFVYVVPEGQRVLVLDRHGRGTIVEGPKRIGRWGKKFVQMPHHVAYPGEFLIIRYRDGRQEHLPGPADAWFDQRIHTSIEKEDALQIAAKEAVVVYFRDDDEQVQRRVERGPSMFVPRPGEWLHTFRWHGSRGSNYKKIPGALVFQKLWLMPDQMYHNVEGTRSSDDVMLTVKLMIFYELLDVEKMLDETHDPIGDFINAVSSDVIDRVSQYTFDQFKGHTDFFNDLENFPQIMGRAKQVGYRINKIVYRGYSTSDSLEQMHEQAVETRTRLKLERETESQSQELADLKQHRSHQRAAHSREEEVAQIKHELERNNKHHEQKLLFLEEQRKFEREQEQLDAEEQQKRQEAQNQHWIQILERLNQLGVDLTPYLTQARADQVIELRGSPQHPPSPHLHLPSTPSPSTPKTSK